VTEWPEFAELDWASLRDRMATPLVVDGRNFLDPQTLKRAGFAYEGIGVPGTEAQPEESEPAPIRPKPDRVDAGAHPGRR
jgi:UDPglucose 6-dehydrogenase